MRTQLEVFKHLRKLFLEDYRGFYIDEYKGQNKLGRNATLYAVRYTAKVWRGAYRDA